MGASSSIYSFDDDEKHFQIYLEITKFYENEYLPEIQAGRLTERQAYVAVKEKFGGLVDYYQNAEALGSTKAMKSNRSTFQMGDVVRVSERGLYREGVVVDILGAHRLKVDFGEFSNMYSVDKCVLVVKSDEYEVGDKVEIQTEGMALYFVGEVVRVHADGGVDVRMSGDDPDDIERDVPRAQVRKLMTKRAMAKNRWRRASGIVVVTNTFLKQIQLKQQGLGEGDDADDATASDEHITAVFDDDGGSTEEPTEGGR